MSDSHYKIFSTNETLYASMLKDISEAREYIFLETYIFENDRVGASFKEILKEKAKAGLEIKVLLDDIGTFVSSGYFRDLREAGADIKFFRKFRLRRKIIIENNNRDHRKLLVIDNRIAYLGSANIAEVSLNWREMNIRLQHKDVKCLRKAFLDNYRIAEKRIFRKKSHLKPVKIGDLDIVRDVPSIKYRKIRTRQLEMIRKAKKEILIEVPYFIPDKRLSRALAQAAGKGVKVVIVLPESSDIKVNDFLRERYLGRIHATGVNIRFFKAPMLHSKLIIVDGRSFSFGSANLNYRSMHLEFEINVFGDNAGLAKKLKEHYSKTLDNTRPFDYEGWKKRSWLQKLMESILSSFKYLM